MSKEAYILVSEEKHGTYYYPAATDEDLAKSALKILTERYEQGYWYHTPEEMFSDETDDGHLWTILMPHLIPEWDRDLPVEKRNEMLKAYTDEHVKPFKETDPDVYESRLKKVKAAIEHEKERRAYKKWYDEMVEVVTNKDLSLVTFQNGRTSPRAWEVLSDRSDHEYEGVELERLQSNDLDEE